MTDTAKVDATPVRVNDREQLIYLLTEAAEIEHGLMCSYLYAAWSLKQHVDEGITPEQLAAVDRWRGHIHGVAMEEMLHLALVSNLLMSIGSPPHFRRQNFPVLPGYHPSSIVVRLAPFSRATAEHFVYLERPEGVPMEPAPGYEPPIEYERHSGFNRLTPTAEDYDTVGHLYRGIEHGFTELAERLSEGALFLGDPKAQVDEALLSFDGFHAVTDMASAQAAIATIIEQGEGARSDAEQSHYARFRAIRDEYDTLLRDDPGFVPHRPVLDDPLMLRPIADAAGIQVTARAAARVLDLANAAYGLMLRLLASGFGVGTTAQRGSEIDSAIEVMSVVKSLAVVLTTLPAGNDGKTAGMNFHLPRSTLALPQREAGPALLAERAREIAGEIEAAANWVPAIDPKLAKQLYALAGRLAP
ncbi:MAG: Ferritin-like [Burkholderia sp.]|nr:Ferritin-like [Burkholderia sp.]